jgi:hypothetical protein
VIEAEFGQPRDLSAMIGVLSRGGGDPAYRRGADGQIWLTGLGPQGSVSMRLRPAAGVITAQFWGEGAQWAADHLEDLLGGHDDPAGFVPVHPIIERQWRRYRDTLRVPRSLLTWQIAVAAVLEQRVTGVEARGAWRGLVSEHGSPAPGPVPGRMRIPPDPARVLRVPSWDWRRYGVDRQRIATVREVARCAHLLSETCLRLSVTMHRDTTRLKYFRTTIQFRIAHKLGGLLTNIETFGATETR